MENQALILKASKQFHFKPRPQSKAIEATDLPPASEDTFPYGWRYIPYTTPDGKESYQQVPLTQADFLDPQIGDKFVQGNKHFELNSNLETILQLRYQDDPDMAVFGDLKMLWGIPNLKEPAPDIAIVPNIKNKEVARNSFNLKKEGAKPCLVIEIVSPNYPGDDTEKVKIYEQVGIKEYIIIDPKEDENTAMKVWGYRLKQGRYEAIKPDTKGRLLSKTTGLYFMVEKEEGENKGKARLRLVDVTTNRPLLNHAETEKARQAEAQARQQAEHKATIETQARQQAEHKASLEAQARQQAEHRASLEAQARQAAEAEIERLKALLNQ